jgi:sulfur-oxidizing protein SoxX
MRRFLLLPLALALASCTTGPRLGERPEAASPADLEKITAVLKRDFRARGQATMDRVELDEVQRLCNLHADNPPPDLARRIEEAQLKTVKFPDGGLMGDWKRGEKIAQSGRGAMWSDKPGVQEGGSCYNCHQISPKEEAFGTVGPSLAGFGKVRGNRPEIQRYAYGKIYNAKAYNACSQMPRFGHSGSLNELLDPASPVNQ